MHLAKLLAGGAQRKPGIVRPQASSATEPAHPSRRSLPARRYDDWTTYTPWLENACTSKARFRAALVVPRRAYSASGYSEYSRTKFRQLSGSTSAISLLNTFTFSHSIARRVVPSLRSAAADTEQRKPLDDTCGANRHAGGSAASSAIFDVTHAQSSRRSFSEYL